RPAKVREHSLGVLVKVQRRAREKIEHAARLLCQRSKGPQAIEEWLETIERLCRRVLHGRLQAWSGAKRSQLPAVCEPPAAPPDGGRCLDPLQSVRWPVHSSCEMSQ